MKNKRKKVFIFESIKGAGKTLLTNKLKEHFPDMEVYGEEITLLPVKHSKEKTIIISHYHEVISRIEKSDSEFFLLDRFHYSKWPIREYDKDYFKEIENSLVEKFAAELIFFKIHEDKILLRLKHTQEYRKDAGWKMNYDGLSLEDEAQRDIVWQKFFMEHQYKNTLIPKKHIMDTTDLHSSMGNLQNYLDEILSIIQKA